jgi:predicted RNA-binding Zn ribbon-like protein
VPSSVSPIGSAKPARIFELVGGHPVLDLVNTLDWRFRDGLPEEFLESYGDLLRFTEQSQLLTPRQTRHLLRSANQSAAERTLASVRELREAAAEVFYAVLDGRNPVSAPVKSLETSFKAARRHQNLMWSGSRLTWGWQETTAAPELPLWLLSLSVVRLMTSDVMQQLRACNNTECRWLFLDTSKNHTRRWCEMRICGNRMKARRFKAQRRA